MDATQALWLLAVPVTAVGVAAAARRTRVPAPLALVVAGLLAAMVPGTPAFELDPEFVLFVFLPPLLFSAAWESSLPNLRENGRTIAYLSVGLVLFTALAVGYAAHLIVPGLPLPAAFVLGAIVAPPDAVAAVSVAKRLGLPRRVVTVLVGESLFNDATALTAYRIAVVAVGGAGVSLLDGGWRFLYAALGGALIGLVAGPPLHRLRTRLRDPLVENSVAVLAPFAAYLVAEAVHASGVIAVVVSGLYLGHRFTDSPPVTRLIGRSFWKVMIFILESVVFLLIGLQLPAVLAGVSGWHPLTLAWWAAAVFGVVVAARFLWVFATAPVPALLSRRGGANGRRLEWRQLTVISWAGMRGVVSLAAAFAIPLSTASGAAFPQRDLISFLTFTTVLGTLLLQGATFPALIRRLGIGGSQEQHADAVAEAGAQHAAGSAALARLETLAAAEGERLDGQVVERLRDLAEYRRLSAWERLGGGTGPGGAEVPTATYRRLRRQMLAAEREVFVRMRDERRIDDEVLDRVLNELDLEEVALSRD
ncbi:monovalent cation:H+ antiporter, CPA1 family [Thermomonospora echinospora]|uniref:Monovalent cation:H+ antiporter, CPA1 family n=1 Tax=Thermomonospora echinospora TaxID=1992 RepID=A0A1H6DFN7_9ACTN|nr:Na+/H+ antiporter [Thermomonospora echinospora]SEG84044.1 monovalent cation:H+ antiporter, CPA1 family [Thermomonospora echinospora]